MSTFLIWIPDNKLGIKSAYYTINEFVALLRKHKRSPKRVQFLADMLEV